ncbi:MAG: FHA domain-containing protein [Coriobacteriia bacterium]|nr:FHA domain-containing protein [Coriobacteriia bacterium]MCL2746293.1 FHA domain-containing protein [Coriobacteriia bacterium]MCL2870685.1 FHA domain-containing protein [Coriobacteriia bacterium]
MPVCQSCGSELQGDSHLCRDCLDTADQSTTSFVPVGRPRNNERIEHSPDDDIFLKIVKGPQIEERFYLEGDYIVIGRDPKAQLFLGDVTVSREHAAIIREGIEVSVRDLGSLNGTYLNGDIVEESLLKSGDIIQIGTFQLMFCWGA